MPHLEFIAPKKLDLDSGFIKDRIKNEDVTDYGIFPNHDLKKQCAQLQTDKIKTHLGSSPEDSRSYYSLARGLGAMARTELCSCPR
jgi:hypothetical protein